MTELSKFEINILRELNGERVEGMRWGAAMSEAIEYLENLGYVTWRMKGGKVYELTDKGRAALQEIEE